jgi:hypothetical protein
MPSPLIIIAGEYSLNEWLTQFQEFLLIILLSGTV